MPRKYVVPVTDGLHAGNIPATLGLCYATARLVRPTNQRTLDGNAETRGQLRTGLHVHPESVEDVAAAMLRLVQDCPFAQALGRAGRAHVLEHANWDHSAAMLMAKLSLLITLS